VSIIIVCRITDEFIRKAPRKADSYCGFTQLCFKGRSAFKVSGDRKIPIFLDRAKLPSMNAVQISKFPRSC